MHAALLLEMAADAMGERIALGRCNGGITYTEALVRTRGSAAWMVREHAMAVAYVGLNSDPHPPISEGQKWTGLGLLKLEH